VNVEVEVRVAAVVTDEAIHVPAKLTDAFFPGLKDPRLLTNSIR
jgi:hypothetical protein